METVEARSLKVGDKIKFPNSRHAQEVLSIEDENGKLRLRGPQVAWLVTPHFGVQREGAE